MARGRQPSSEAAPLLRGLPSLREMRRASGLSQAAAAERVGCAAQCLKHYESGRSQPTPERWIALLELYGWTVRATPKDGTQQTFDGSVTLSKTERSELIRFLAQVFVEVEGLPEAGLRVVLRDCCATWMRRLA